jgi:hypothetical protein
LEFPIARATRLVAKAGLLQIAQEKAATAKAAIATKCLVRRCTIPRLAAYLFLEAMLHVSLPNLSSVVAFGVSDTMQTFQHFSTPFDEQAQEALSPRDFAGFKQKMVSASS